MRAVVAGRVIICQAAPGESCSSGALSLCKGAPATRGLDKHQAPQGSTRGARLICFLRGGA